MKKENYLKIKVGDIIADKENQKILKQLFNKKTKQESAQNLLDSIDTKIKRPRFER